MLDQFKEKDKLPSPTRYWAKPKTTNDRAIPSNKWVGREHVGPHWSLQIKWLSFFLIRLKIKKKQSTFWSHKGNLLKTIIKESVLVCDLLFENYGEFRNQSVNESGFDASWSINCPTASRWSYITGPL